MTKITPEWLLRFSLAVVYFWFGALKLIGLSPALGLVRSVSPLLATIPLYIGLALFEMGIGVALLVGFQKRWTAAAVILHLIGTFGVLVASPQSAFLPEFPFLTLEGEFVVKNLVLLGAAVALFIIYAEERLTVHLRLRAWVLTPVLVLSIVVGFAASRLHEALRMGARSSINEVFSSTSIPTNAASIDLLTGDPEHRSLVLEGVMVDRCRILGCWMKLQDSTGTVFVDLAPAHLSARGIPLGSRIRVQGSLGKTREGNIGLVASSFSLLPETAQAQQGMGARR